MPDPETQELQIDLARRERTEREQARTGSEPEERTHDRRADKQAYLQEKLQERARAEDEAG